MNSEVGVWRYILKQDLMFYRLLSTTWPNEITPFKEFFIWDHFNDFNLGSFHRLDLRQWHE